MKRNWKTVLKPICRFIEPHMPRVNLEYAVAYNIVIAFYLSFDVACFLMNINPTCWTIYVYFMWSM